MNKSRNKDGTYKKRIDGEMFEGFAVYEDNKGYKIIWLDGKDVKIHVFVWERENGIKPKGYEIHHLDHNKGNYSLDNLELLTISDHRRVHAGWLRFGNAWSHKPCTKCERVLPLSDFYPRRGHTPSAQCKPCHCKTTAKWAKKNPEKRKEIGNAWYHRNKTGGKANV